MIDNVQHGVLGGVLTERGPEQLERFMHASSMLTDDHFAPYERAAWMFMGRLLAATGAMPDFKIIDHYLPQTQLQIEVQAEVRQLWLQLESQPKTDESAFRYAVYMTHELRKKDLLAQTLGEAGSILLQNTKVGKKELEGYDDARRHLEDQLLRIDGMEREAMPEGNLRTSRDELLDLPMTSSMVKLTTGLPPLDSLTGGGFGPGQLCLIAGYTNEGKSFFCVNIAWAMVMAGYNVVYFTTETVKREVDIRMAVRHSHLPKFGCPGGLDYSAVLSNEMTPEQHLIWQAVAEDFTDPDQPYGRFDVIQVAEGTSMSTIRAKLRAYQSVFHVDACFIDELQMLTANNSREDSQSELEETVRAAMKLAIDFDGGRGIPVISPWQIKRADWEAARTNGGRYTRASLGNTAEAERRAAIIVSLFRHIDSIHRVSCQVLKQRSGPTGDFEGHVDFAHCIVRAERAALEIELPAMNV